VARGKNIECGVKNEPRVKKLLQWWWVSKTWLGSDL